ncbi:MAG: hypothetical protein HAW67_06095 [Endozoicomonadaceae bacterium]|nr:hypothetical protein [Endozoicomonadaceae bacterium]
MPINRPVSFFNKISDSQIEQLIQVTKLSVQSLENFVLQLECFFDDLGKLQKNSKGEINLINRENHAKILKEKLHKIENLCTKLKKEVDSYNSLCEIDLAIGSDKFNVSPTFNSELKCNSYPLIRVSHYLELVIQDVNFRADDYGEDVKATSQVITKLFYRAWCHIPLEDNAKLLKNSDSNLFIQCLCIITGWEPDLARKIHLKQNGIN